MCCQQLAIIVVQQQIAISLLVTFETSFVAQAVSN